MSRLPAGTDIILLQADGETPGWKVRAGGGGSGNDISLIRFDSSGVEQDSPVIVDWATGNVTLTADIALGDDITAESITATGTVQAEQLTSTDDANVTGTVTAGSMAAGGAAIADANALANDVVLGDTSGSGGSAGLSIVTDDTGIGRIYVGGATDDDAFRVLFDIANNLVQWYINGTAEFEYTSAVFRPAADGGYGIGTTGRAFSAVHTQGFRAGYRAVAQDGALTLATTDYTIHLDTLTGTKAATMTTTGMGAGQKMRVLMLAATAGAYTLGCTWLGVVGDVTLNAAGEGVDLVFDGTVWQAEVLIGGATFA